MVRKGFVDFEEVDVDDVTTPIAALSASVAWLYCKYCCCTAELPATVVFWSSAFKSIPCCVLLLTAE